MHSSNFQDQARKDKARHDTTRHSIPFFSILVSVDMPDCTLTIKAYCESCQFQQWTFKGGLHSTVKHLKTTYILKTTDIANIDILKTTDIPNIDILKTTDISNIDILKTTDISNIEHLKTTDTPNIDIRK
jgi:hypothetical protein